VIAGDDGEQRALIDRATFARAFLQPTLAEDVGRRFASDDQNRQSLGEGVGDADEQRAAGNEGADVGGRHLHAEHDGGTGQRGGGVRADDGAGLGEGGIGDGRPLPRAGLDRDLEAQVFLVFLGLKKKRKKIYFLFLYFKFFKINILIEIKFFINLSSVVINCRLN
jgi:hypothetical protein